MCICIYIYKELCISTYVVGSFGLGLTVLGLQSFRVLGLGVQGLSGWGCKGLELFSLACKL